MNAPPQAGAAATGSGPRGGISPHGLAPPLKARGSVAIERARSGSLANKTMDELFPSSSSSSSSSSASRPSSGPDRGLATAQGKAAGSNGNDGSDSSDENSSGGSWEEGFGDVGVSCEAKPNESTASPKSPRGKKAR